MIRIEMYYENRDFELNVIYKSKLYESISKLVGVKILEIWYKKKTLASEGGKK